MELLQRVRGIPEFWDRIASAQSRLLALDYDGTLAPFRVSRMEARPFPGVIDALRTIQEDARTQVAIVSGRPTSELLQLVGALPFHFIGSHGWEWRGADGSSVKASVSPAERAALAEGQKLTQQAGLGNLLELKIGSLALHSRGLEEAARIEHRVKGLWQPLIERFSLEVRQFNGGIELRLLEHNKGTALTELRERSMPDSLVVYVGDDETDEDAFRAIRGFGLGIRVGETGVSSAASGFLESGAEVLRFLQTWSAVADRVQERKP